MDTISSHNTHAYIIDTLLKAYCINAQSTFITVCYTE